MPEAIEIAIAWAIVIGTVGGVATVFTLVRTRLKAAGRPSGADPAEIADLREMVRRLDGEVAELTERVDFAERLLAKQRDVEKLKGTY